MILLQKKAESLITIFEIYKHLEIVAIVCGWVISIMHLKGEMLGTRHKAKKRKPKTTTQYEPH